MVNSELPEGYKEIYSLDLMKDKRLKIFVNALSLLIGAVMVLVGNSIVPILSFFIVEDRALSSIRLIVFAVSMFAYVVLHELVHGITMKLYGAKKVHYGVVGPYAFASSDELYDKWSYTVIALAPIVVWGIVLAVLNAVVPEQWFWVVYFVQIMNVSGASGDMFVTARFLKFPDDVLIKDHGVGMVVYSKKNTLS